MVPAKLSRTPARTCSIPTSNVTLSAMDATVSDVVRTRLRSERSARRGISMSRSPGDQSRAGLVAARLISPSSTVREKSGMSV